MKANKEQAMFRVLTGSWLYGTATPASDYDYKTVVLPPLDVLLLNTKVTNRKEKPEGAGPGDKMQAGETETEYLPLQVFMDDFYSGQTYALEVAFAVVQGKFEVLNSKHGDGEWVTPEQARDERFYFFARNRVSAAQRVCSDLVWLFLTRNVKKMVGYAVSQSKVYGLKTERYTSLAAALRVLNNYGRDNIHTNEQRDTLTFVDIPELVEYLLKLKHVQPCQILNGAGGTEMAAALDICGKQYPLTNKVVTVVRALEKSLGNYGERVKEFEGEGVDWKALSHAIRITGQAVELLNFGKLQFPSQDASYLLAVKSGEVPLDEATSYLGHLFEKIDPALEKTELQERTLALDATFVEWKVGTLRELYDLS
jgi:hypothetical protein